MILSNVASSIEEALIQYADYFFSGGLFTKSKQIIELTACLLQYCASLLQ